MDYKIVYRSLMELFPQVDPRILKAVAIEHPKDADEAAAVVIAEFVPLFKPYLAGNSTQPGNKTLGNVTDNKEIGASSSGNVPVVVDCHHETRALVTELSRPVESGMVSSDSPASVQAVTNLTSNGWQGVDFQITSTQAELSTDAVSEDAVEIYTADKSTVTQKSDCFEFGFGSSDDVKEASSGSLAVENGDAMLSGSNFVDETSKSSVSVENGDPDSAILNRFGSSDDVKEVSSGSLAVANGDAMLSGSNFVDETSRSFLAVENGDPEMVSASSSIVSISSTQECNIDHLEQIIEDARSNKKTLFTVMESVMNLMREVELQEKDAEKMKKDAARGGFDTFDKVEKLKKTLEHAKEANDMHAGEVYGERSILTTEVTELENRLVNLSEERDKSLSVLDEMRGVLETRIAVAVEIKEAAEEIIEEKEGSARKAFAEQEAIMEKVVQRSKLLQQEAERNSKLREYLMNRGRIVDSLQGEISVICQDIRHLKEKFDNKVPLSQSISSSQTSCKLASSGSYDKPKEFLEDGWDIFDKDTEL